MYDEAKLTLRPYIDRGRGSAVYFLFASFAFVNRISSENIIFDCYPICVTIILHTILGHSELSFANMSYANGQVAPVYPNRYKMSSPKRKSGFTVYASMV